MEQKLNNLFYECVDELNKIGINILHEKNTAEIDDFINSCEEEILLGKIQNEEQLYQNINEKIKESLKKYFSRFSNPKLKEIKPEIIEKINIEALYRKV